MRNNLFFGSASHRERVLPISSYTTTTHTMCRSCCCCSEFFINSSSFTSTPQCSHFPLHHRRKIFLSTQFSSSFSFVRLTRNNRRLQTNRFLFQTHLNTIFLERTSWVLSVKNKKKRAAKISWADEIITPISLVTSICWSQNKCNGKIILLP